MIIPKGYDGVILDLKALEKATMNEQWEVTRAAAEAARRVEAQIAASRFGRRTGQLAGSIMVERRVTTKGVNRGTEHALIRPNSEVRAGAYTGVRIKADKPGQKKRRAGHYSGSNMEIAAILHFGTQDGRLPKTGWMTDAARAASGPALAAAKREYRKWLAKHWARRAP